MKPKITFLLAVLACFLSSGALFAQKVQITATPLSPATRSVKKKLDKQFKKVQLLNLPLATLQTAVKTGKREVQFSFPTLGELSFTILPYNIYSPNYKAYIIDAEGKKEVPRPENITYKGFLNGEEQPSAGFTITEKSLVASFQYKGETWFLQNAAQLDKNIPADAFALYREKDVIADKNAMCGVVSEDVKQYKAEQIGQHKKTKMSTALAPGTFTIDLAQAADFLMYTKNSSNITTTQNYMTGVINLVNTDYLVSNPANLGHTITFVISEQFVSTTAVNAAETAWGSTTSPFVLLPNFADWGVGGGFSGSFDLAQLWTDRNFDGSTIGLAYLSAVCENSIQYQVLQDFNSGNTSLTRCLVSHELGHNVGISHDAPGSPNIMAPAVSSATTWSTQSKEQFLYFAGNEDLSCVTNASPAVYGRAKQVQPCVNETVELIGSIRRATSQQWTMAGGSITSATTANTTTSYSTTGVKNITLDATHTTNGDAVTNNLAVEVFAGTAPTAACNINANGSFTYYPVPDGIYRVELAGLDVSTGGTYGDGQIYVGLVCGSIATLTTNTNEVAVTVSNSVNSPEAVSVWIDYDNNGTFSNSTERVMNLTTGTGRRTATFNVPSGALTNTLLRMRVVSAVSNNPSACTTPSFGQVEDYGVMIMSAALPVTLTELKANRKNNDILVEWATASEIQARSYMLERSADGIIFETLGEVKAAGNSNARKDYNFLDKQPLFGSNYYRLRQIDLNGAEHFSTIIQATFELGEKITLFPTQIGNGEKITLLGKWQKSGKTTLQWVNTMGVIVGQQTLSINAGDQRIELENLNLPKGYYTLLLQNAENKDIQAFKVMKY